MPLRRNADTKSFLLSKDRENLMEMLQEMGQAVEKMILMSTRALEEKNDSIANEVVASDEIVDKFEIEIEQECLRIIAVRQPVREELRFFFSVLKIITDLERLGDEACNIAQHVLKADKEPLLEPLVDIPRMTSICIEMLKNALRSFEDNDPELAKKVFLKDDEIDALFKQVMDDLFITMESETDSDNAISKNTILLQIVARHLERMGDHAANISERSFYMTTGKRIKKELPMK